MRKPSACGTLRYEERRMVSANGTGQWRTCIVETGELRILSADLEVFKLRCANRRLSRHVARHTDIHTAPMDSFDSRSPLTE
jgi:hypothetical protein